MSFTTNSIGFSRNGFDLFVEQLCQPHYQSGGRPSIPPGVYSRMLMIGYMEGIDSQRGIAWRCEDSLALRRFLGISLSEKTPDHSSLTRIRDRLPLCVHAEVFQYILFAIEEQDLLKAKTVGVDSTSLETNAAMKAIIRRDTGDDWKAYLKCLMKEDGLLQEGDDDSTDEELRRHRPLWTAFSATVHSWATNFPQRESFFATPTFRAFSTGCHAVLLHVRICAGGGRKWPLLPRFPMAFSLTRRDPLAIQVVDKPLATYSVFIAPALAHGAIDAFIGNERDILRDRFKPQLERMLQKNHTLISIERNFIAREIPAINITNTACA
jgi:transposase